MQRYVLAEKCLNYWKKHSAISAPFRIFSNPNKRCERTHAEYLKSNPELQTKWNNAQYDCERRQSVVTPIAFPQCKHRGCQEVHALLREESNPSSSSAERFATMRFSNIKHRNARIYMIRVISPGGCTVNRNKTHSKATNALFYQNPK